MSDQMISKRRTNYNIIIVWMISPLNSLLDIITYENIEEEQKRILH